MEVVPFQALRPAPGYEHRVAALPYDVVEVAEARELVAAEPLSFLAVDLPEAHFPDDADALAPAVFHQARAALMRLRQAGALIVDSETALYVYRLTWRGQVQTGLVGCFAVDDYLDGTIARHEVTRAQKEEGRLRHIQTLEAQTGLVFLTWRESDEDELVALLAEISAGEPLYRFTDAYGVTNEIWRAADPTTVAALEAAVAAIPKAYIADGHHRAAAAARHCLEERKAAERRAEELEAKGGELEAEDTFDSSEAVDVPAAPDAPYNYFLAGLYPSGELTVLAYHRVVADRAGLSPKTLLEAIAQAGYDVTPVAAAPTLGAPGELGLYTADQWWLLTDTAREPEDLDVTHLQERVLGPILGIGDPREDPRIAFVGGNEEPEALEVAAGSEGVAFLLYPTEVSQLMAVADAGATMPPKSTWFEPKLRSGLILHPLS